MAGRLPKVTEYIKNMGKSVGYAAIETVTEPTETARDFLDTNEELFKTIYAAAKNYRQTMKVIDRSIKRSKVYEAANLGLKAMKEDLKSGKFYNKERENEYGMQGVMGDDFADFSEFESDDFGNWDDTDEGDESESSDSGISNETKATLMSSNSISAAINNSSMAQATMIANSTKTIADVNMASTKLLYMQNEKVYSSLINGFSGVTNGVNMINSILSGPVNNYMNQSVKFYEDVSNKLNETNSYLKELTEMQRNLYKVQQQTYENDKYNDIVSSSGAPDLTAYAKNIYKNIASLDPTGGMLSGGDGNMFKVFIGSPLKAIPMMLAKTLIPSVVTTTLKAFDENMSGLFSSMIARFNTWAEGDNGAEGIDFKGIIGNLLGIKLDKKTSVDPSKYQRGPMPFDGETKKAIVDVIPQQLARIEAAVSGRPVQYYDSLSGRFKTEREIHKGYKTNQENAWSEAVSSISDSFDKWANMVAADRKERNELQEKFKKLGKEVYESGGDFNPYLGFGPKGERNNELNPYVEIFGEDTWKSFANYLRDNDKKGVYQIAGNTFNATQNRSRYLRSLEGQFGSAGNILFNGSMLDIDKNGKLTRFNPNGGGIGAYYKDSKHFKSVTDYLKDILAEVRYIRMHGTSGGKTGGKRRKGSSPQTSFDDFYKSNFIDDSDIEEPEKKEDTSSFTREKAPKEKSTAEKLGITQDNILKEFDQAKTLSEKWKAMKKGVDKLLRSPAKWITDIIHKADERVYQTMFGDESGETFSDKAGRPYRSFMEYLVARTSDLFDQLQERFKKGFSYIWDKFKKTKVGNWVYTKGKDFTKNVGSQLKNKFGWAKQRAASALDSTYGTMYESMKAGKILSADDVKRMRQQRRENAEYYDDLTNLYSGNGGDAVTGPVDLDELYQNMNIENNAYGGMVNKYGLTMVSPGEIIIPNGDNDTRRRNLSNENKEKAKLIRNLKGGKSIGNYANGTTTNNSNDSKLWKAIKKVMGEVSGEGAGIAADALIGSGVSLVTGLFGGPLLGAAAGAGIGIVKKSETAQKFLFGDIDENGQRKGGVIPKNVIDFFNKNSKGMIDFGVAGAVAGLFTPLGLVGGALAGATLGWAKNTDAFKEFMFGSVEKGTTGLMTPETKEKIEKALPKMGIGAAAGIFLGPFGLVGNAMLGAAGGYVASTEKFKELIFGKEDKDGKKHGGLVGALKDGFINPLAKTGKKIALDLKDYAQKYIIDPTKDFLKGSGQFIRNIFISIGDRVADGINGVFAKHLGIPLEEFFRERVFKRAASIITGATKALLAPAKFFVSAPFRALGFVGRNMQASQIKRGTMDTMTAKQRNKFRKNNKARFLMGDKTAQLDQMLEGASLEDLESMNANMDTFIKNRGAKNIEFNNLIDELGGSVSDLFDENGVWAKRGHAPLKNALKDKKVIMKALRNGNLDDVRKRLRKVGMSDDAIEEFIQTSGANRVIDARQAMIDESGLDKESINKLEKATGFTNLHKGGNRWTKQLKRLMGTELKSRQAEEASKTPEQKALEAQTEQQKDSSTKIIDLLGKINQNLYNIGHTKITDSGKVITVTESTGGKMTAADDRGTQEGLEENKQATETQKEIANNMETTGGFFRSLLGIQKKDKKKKDKPSLLSRIFGGGSSGGAGLFSSLLGGGIGGKLKIAGMIGAGLVGVSALGWGSQFLKEKVAPWFTDTLLPKIQQSKFYQNIKAKFDSFVGSIKDGSLFKSLANKFVQGLVFAMKNITVPLVAAVVKTLPKIGAGIVSGILSGLWDAIKGIFVHKTKTVDSNISQDFNSSIKGLPVGDEESNFAKHFSGSVVSGTSGSGNYSFDSVSTLTNKAFGSSSNGSSRYKIENMPKYEGPGTYTNENGTTSEVDNNGNVTVYDANGTALGSYNNETGDITGTHYATETESTGSNLIKNGVIRGVLQGKTNGIFNAAGKAGTSLVAGADKVLDNKLITKLPGVKGSAKLVKMTGGAGQTLGKIGSGFTTVGRTAGNFFKDPAKALANLGKKGSSMVADSAATYAKNSLANTSTLSRLAGNTAASIQKKFGTFFEKLADSKLIQKMVNGLGKTGKYASKAFTSIKDLFPKLGEKIGKQVASKGTGAISSKVLNALGGLSPIAIAFWLYSFEEGMRRCETILGVAKTTIDIPVGARVLTGLVKAINDNLLWGLIPIETLMKIVIDLFGNIVGVDAEELKEAQAVTAELTTQASIASGKEVTVGMLNNQGNIFSSIKNWITGENKKYLNMTSAGNNYSSSYSTGSYTYNTAGRGRGRGGNQGGIYAGMKYGNSTIGQSGCAPVAASMLMNGNVPEAAKFAQSTGHVSSDGSTDIGFFNDYFSAKGISNRTTTNKNDVSTALKHGQKAVLLGQDPGGGPDSAYSSSSHFITAQGMDKNGNVIVDDPELGRRKMSQNKVFKNMKASVVTGRGRSSGIFANFRGRGSDDEASGSGNANQVIAAAKSQVGTTDNGGKCLYNQEYKDVTGGGSLTDPWCCKFVWWAFRHAGLSQLFYGGNAIASCTALMNYYKDKKRMVSFSQAQPGDIIFFNFKHNSKTSAAHVGIVTAAPSGGKIATVEGNTSKPGASGNEANGHGVWEKNRPEADVIGVARPEYAGATVDPNFAGTYNTGTTGEDGESSTNSIFSAITNLGASFMKAIYGENAYNALAGNSSDDSSSTGIASNADNNGNLAGNSNAEKIWTYLRSLGYSKQGTAAVMGSLYKESGLMPNNLQNSYNTKFGLTDEEYTNKVNNGSYSKNKFVNDSGGYGLGQWTFSSRKEKLYDKTVGSGISVADLKSQLDLLDSEVTNGGLTSSVKNATNISSANNEFISKFEKPAGYENKNSSTYTGRLSAAQGYYDQFKGTGRAGSTSSYVNNYSVPTSTAMGASGSSSGVVNSDFLQQIAKLLLTIATNTQSIKDIYQILADNGIDTSNVKADETMTKDQAKKALNRMMNSKNDSETFGNIMQTKDTTYLVNIMSQIAQE